MSDKDKLVIIVFSFIFLVSFFFLFLTGPYPNGALFQYLFFIAALTMAFTGFLGATGTFATKDQTLGGGAAIFIVMVLSVVGLKFSFEPEDALAKLVHSAKIINKNEELSVESATDYARNIMEEYPKLKEENSKLTVSNLDLSKKAKEVQEKLESSQKALKKTQETLTTCQKGSKECQDKLKQCRPQELSLVVHPLSSPFNILLPDDEVSIVNIDGDNNLSGIQKDGKKYKVPLSVLKGGFMMQLRNQSYKFEPLIVRYDYDNTLLELYVTNK